MPLLKPLTLFTALTLTGCENVALNAPIEAEGVKDTAYQFCAFCGHQSILTFYTNPNEFLQHQQARRKRSKRIQIQR